jgi:hypothetical protein
MSDDDRAVLEKWARARRVTNEVARRSRLLLRLADGLSVRAVAAEVGASVVTVRLWRDRFLSGGPDVLNFCSATASAKKKATKGRDREDFDARRNTHSPDDRVETTDPFDLDRRGIGSLALDPPMDQSVRPMGSSSTAEPIPACRLPVGSKGGRHDLRGRER